MASVELAPRLQVEIANWISRYLAADVSLDDLQAWFVAATWDVDRTSPELAELAHRLELLLAEARHRSAEEFRAELATLLSEAMPENRLLVTSSASRTFIERPAGSSSLAGR